MVLEEESVAHFTRRPVNEVALQHICITRTTKLVEASKIKNGRDYSNESTSAHHWVDNQADNMRNKEVEHVLDAIPIFSGQSGGGMLRAMGRAIHECHNQAVHHRRQKT
jgi:hypothetical protein